jgi:uncharacterized protein YqgC (DUF456 family)
MMDTIYLILSLVIMTAGLAGTVLPVLPSIPLVYSGFLIYGFGTGWHDFGTGIVVFFGALTVLVLVLDYVAGAVGAKKYGASSAGVIGSIIGAIAGVIFFNVIGLLVGVFAGAVFGELYCGRTTEAALRSGWGAFLGFLAGTLFKFLIAFAMIGAFLLLIV